MEIVDLLCCRADAGQAEMKHRDRQRLGVSREELPSGGWSPAGRLQWSERSSLGVAMPSASVPPGRPRWRGAVTRRVGAGHGDCFSVETGLSADSAILRGRKASPIPRATPEPAGDAPLVEASYAWTWQVVAQAPFVGDTTRDVRFVWDPVVHDRYGEKCYVTLIGLIDPNETTLKAIEQYGKECGIVCFSAYLVLGTYDMIVRCWATRSSYDTFWEGLERFRFRKRVDLAATFVDYSGWTTQNHELTIRDVGTYETDIRNVCSITAAPASVRQSLANLRGARLIHKIVPVAPRSSDPVPYIKLYLCLNLIDSDQMKVMRRNEREASAFIAAVRDVLHSSSEFESVSLYFGYGEYDCIAKVVIQSTLLPTITSSLFRIQDTLLRSKGLHVRNETMIVGGQSTEERDVINPDFSDGGPNARLMQSIVSAESVPLVSTLRDPWRAAVFEVFERWYEDLLDHDQFGAILESGLHSDLDALWEACTFALKLESKARRQFVTRSFPALLGDRWHSATMQALSTRVERATEKVRMSSGNSRTQAEADCALAERLQAAFRKDAARLALGDYIAITKTLLELDIVSHPQVEEALGQTWGSYLEALRDLRNDIGHYNDIEEYETKDDSDRVARWKSLAESALSVSSYFKP